MAQIIYLIRHSKWFWMPVLVFLLLGLCWIWQVDNTAISLWINGRHSIAGDVFWRAMTWMGDGITMSILIFLLLFIRFRTAFLAAAALLVSSLAAQWLKHFFAHDRPSLILSGMDLHLVPGVQLYAHFSFPSGHTTAAFCIYGVLAVLSGRPVLQWLFFLIAALVGISRIYLLQHFMEDVLFGALLGTMTAYLLTGILLHQKWMWTSVWDQNLLSLIRKK